MYQGAPEVTRVEWVWGAKWNVKVTGSNGGSNGADHLQEPCLPIDEWGCDGWERGMGYVPGPKA